MAVLLGPPTTRQIPGHPNLRVVHWVNGCERLGTLSISCPRSRAEGTSIRICTRFRTHSCSTLLYRNVRSVEKGHWSLLAREIASLRSNESSHGLRLSPWARSILADWVTGIPTGLHFRSGAWFWPWTGREVTLCALTLPAM